MKITGIELRRVAMPLVAPFRTSFGTETARDILLVRVVTPDAEGWGVDNVSFGLDRDRA
jgi:o-succinylbenzoate synthase